MPEPRHDPSQNPPDEADAPGAHAAPPGNAAPPLRFPGHRVLTLGQPRIMGILNVTPDSFSDGGAFFDGTDAALDAAVQHALDMARQGAAILDVGGESTRPGAQRIDAQTQIARVVPVIRRIRAALDEHHRQVVLSIDTTRAAVAEAALRAGASMLNDVSAGREDDAMFAVAAEHGVPIVLMHMQGQPATMQRSPSYGDVVAEVLAFLQSRVRVAQSAGVPRDQIVIDPGIGFGKTVEHNLALLAALPRFMATGNAVLLGASRKRFLDALLPCSTDPGRADHAQRDRHTAEGSIAAPTTDDRVPGTVAVTALAVAAGVPLLRVHDVAPNARAAAVARAVVAASTEPGEPA